MVAIITILVFVFLSQQIYFKNVGENLVSAATNSAQAQISKGSEWVDANIISKVTGGVENGGETIKNDVEQNLSAQAEKNNPENILEKTKNYFSGIVDSIIKPGTPQNCPAVTTP